MVRMQQQQQQQQRSGSSGVSMSPKSANSRNWVALKKSMNTTTSNLTPSVSIAPVTKKIIPPPPMGSDSDSENEDVKPPLMQRKRE